MISLDTKIITVYEGPKAIGSLLLDLNDVMVYSWDQESKMAKITTLDIGNSLIKTNSKVLRIEFDSGLVVHCTPDQNFYMFRGYKTPARALQKGQSVRAFSGGIHERDGHIRVHGWVDGKARHQYVARMVWEYFNGPVPDGMIIHHKDFSKTNNDISNLELLTNGDHTRIHHTQRNRGYRARNHKVVSVDLSEEVFDVVKLDMDDDAFIIADDTPVSGDFSGIVLAAL